MDFAFSLLSFGVFMLLLTFAIITRKQEGIDPFLLGAYLVFSAAAAVWNLGYSVMFYTTDRDLALLFYYRVSSIGWTLIPLAGIHFIYQLYVRYLGRPARRLAVFLIFLPYPAFLWMAMSGRMLATDLVRTPLGWAEVMPADSPWFILFTTVTVLDFVFCLALLFFLMRKVKMRRHRFQINFIVFPALAMVSLTLIINVLVPALGFSGVPPVGHLLMGGWTVFVGYALQKYPLLSVRPAAVVDTILMKMYDIVILTDLEGVVLTVNPAIEALLGYARRDLEGRPLGSLFVDPPGTVRFNGAGVERFIPELSFRTAGGERIPCQCVLTLVKDRFDDPVGYLLFAHDIRAMKDLEALTDKLREQQAELQKNYAVIETYNENMRRELYLARMIQRSLMPPPPRDMPGVTLHAFFQPMLDVGGDLYDFIRFKERHRIGVFISDVSGHGIPAALIASMMKTVIGTAGKEKLRPDALLSCINASIMGQTNQNFVTAFYGVYDTETRVLTFARGGHPFPCLVRAGGHSMIRSRGTIIGLFDNAQYELANVSLMPGDKVLLFTDGFLEATNGRKEIFEEAALGRALAAHAHRPVRELMECIYKELRDFRGSDHFEDDICVVGLEVH